MKHRFLFSLQPMIVIFLLHVVVGLLFLYDRYPDIDIPMHLLGGFVTAMSLVRFQIWAEERGSLPHMQGFAQGILGIAGVSLVAVVWEFYEFIGDQLIVGAQFQMGLADTMGDLFCGLVGGTAYFIFLRYQRLRSIASRAK